MEAASKGCKEEGGLTVAILPTHTGEEANAYVDVRLPTGMGWTRNSFVAMASDALIVVGGRSGTLSEIAYGWMYDKPVVALTADGVEGWGPKLAGSPIDNRRDDQVWAEETPAGAVARAFNLAAERGRGEGKAAPTNPLP